MNFRDHDPHQLEKVIQRLEDCVLTDPTSNLVLSAQQPASTLPSHKSYPTTLVVRESVNPSSSAPYPPDTVRGRIRDIVTHNLYQDHPSRALDSATSDLGNSFVSTYNNSNTDPLQSGTHKEEKHLYLNYPYYSSSVELGKTEEDLDSMSSVDNVSVPIVTHVSLDNTASQSECEDEEDDDDTDSGGTREELDDQSTEMQVPEEGVVVVHEKAGRQGDKPVVRMGIQSLEQENAMVRRELDRVEDLLAQCRAERDELAIKYSALCERMDISQSLDSVDISSLEEEKTRKTLYLRRKLEEEHASYKRKLQIYQEGQERQIQLVQKLQSKVLHYKKKVGDLEAENNKFKNQLVTLKSSMQCTTDNFISRLESTEARIQASQEDRNVNFETTANKLEEEEQRCTSLRHVNSLLRDQLDQATQSNQSLTADLQRLTAEWQNTQADLERREAQWRREEAVFNEYFAGEHGRLLSLWRAVVDFRRRFVDMRTFTERDLSQLRNEMSRMSQTMHSACLNTRANQEAAELRLKMLLDQAKADKTSLENQLESKGDDLNDANSTITQLQAHIAEISVQQDRLKNKLSKNEETLQSLQFETPITASVAHSRYSSMPPLRRRSFTEARSDDAIQILKDDADMAQQALADISHAVLLDAEGDDLLNDAIANSISAPATLHRRSSLPPSQQKANTTYAAVQSALNKRALQVQECRAKLSSTKETVVKLKSQLTESETERRKLENQLITLREECDVMARHHDAASRERDRAVSSLSTSSGDKVQLERQVGVLGDQLISVRDELEKSRSELREAQVKKDSLQDKCDDLNREIDRITRDNERCKKNCSSLEERVSQLKTDNTANREGLHRALLDRDVLEHEKQELVHTLARVERQKAELELTITKIRAEEASLNDVVARLECERDAIGFELGELRRQVTLFDEEKIQWTGEKQALEKEKNGMKEALIRMENERVSLDTEKAGLSRSVELAEMTREALEKEVTQLAHERLGLVERLGGSDRREAASRELANQLRAEIESQCSALVRMTSEKETLNKERAELMVQLSASEKEVRVQKDSIADLKSDKDQLESLQYEAQQQIAQLESKIIHLDTQINILTTQKESLQGDLARTRQEFDVEINKVSRSKNLTSEAWKERESELKNALDKIRREWDEDREKGSRELSKMREEVTKMSQRATESGRLEREAEIATLVKEKRILEGQVTTLQRERDDALLNAESNRQQNLSCMEHERSSLQEKLFQSEAKVTSLKQDLEKNKAHVEAKVQQEKERFEKVGVETQRLKEKLEEMSAAHSQELNSMASQLTDLTILRDQSAREANELKLQLKMAEEARDNFKKELLQANSKFRKSEEEKELGRKEVIDAKRLVQEEARDKALLEKANVELRSQVKEVESSKGDLARALSESKQRLTVLEDQHTALKSEASELRSSLRQIEKARLDTKREVQELRVEMGRIDSEKMRLAREVQELRLIREKEEQREENNRRDIFNVKQRIVESDANRESLRKELTQVQRKLVDNQEMGKMRERETKALIEEHEKEKSKWTERRRGLETELERCLTHIEDLKSSLSSAEGRATGLDCQVTQLSEAYRASEDRLSNIHSCLRRLLGFRQTPTAQLSPQRRPRSITPGRQRPRSRSQSPVKLESRTSSLVHLPAPSQLDPEAVRSTLRDFVNQLLQAERDREEAQTRARASESKATEAIERAREADNRADNLHKKFMATNDAKQSVEEKLSSVQTVVLLQEETVKRHEKERKSMSDAMGQLERKIATLQADKIKAQEALEDLRGKDSVSAEERRQWRKTIDEAENRCTQIELTKKSLEGDLHRLKVALRESETDNQCLEERCESMCKMLEDMESKAESLQQTVERLNATLAATEEAKNNEKDAVQQLSHAIQEQNITIQTLQDSLAQMQKTLTSSEQDRQLLQERLETSRVSLSESKSHVYSLQERIHSLQTDLEQSEMKRTEVEGEARYSASIITHRQESEQELKERLTKMLAEKNSTAEKIALMQKTINDLDTTKRELERSNIRMEKDKTALRKTLEKVEREKLNYEDMMNKTELQKVDLDISLRRLEEDNCDLHREIQSLQIQMAQSGQMHSQRLTELTERHQSEIASEVGRLKTGQSQIEKSLESRERAHRQRIQSLEDQVSTLKEQLNVELRKRQQFLRKSASGLVNTVSHRCQSPGVISCSQDVAELRTLLDSAARYHTSSQDLNSCFLHDHFPTRHSVHSQRSPPTRRPSSPSTDLLTNHILRPVQDQTSPRRSRMDLHHRDRHSVGMLSDSGEG